MQKKVTVLSFKWGNLSPKTSLNVISHSRLLKKFMRLLTHAEDEHV